MKIINLKTNNIFDLPKEDAELLLSSSPELFAKISKNNRVIKTKKNIADDSVLSKISDE